MDSKFKFILMLLMVLLGFTLVQILFFVTHKNVSRSPTSLMNQYYKIKSSDPLAAKRILEFLIKKQPQNQAALRELGFWYLAQGDIRSSVAQFEIAYRNDANDTETATELSKLYFAINQPDKAQTILSKLASAATTLAAKESQESLKPTLPPSLQPIKISTTAPLTDFLLTSPLLKKVNSTVAEALLMNIQQVPPHLSTNNKAAEPTLTKSNQPASISTISNRDKMLNEFYDLKKKNSSLAWNKINEVVTKYPNDVQALKEAGYYALLTLKSNKLAKQYFIRVYQLTCDPKIALQLGYIYDTLNEKRVAYHYFDLATNTPNMKDKMTAEISKSNLRGVQTKFLPYPYYASVDYSPLYMSRFKLLIQPIIARLGVEVNKPFGWKFYLSYRRTSDNKSNTNNFISSIYEDNAAITALGSQLNPIPLTPQLIMFAEWGKSVDLVYRRRSRWRTDFRGGLAYYNEWGRPVEYTFQPKLMLQPNADIYADAIYYNRYHDGIATMRIRPGVKVFRYGSMTLDLYYRIFIIEDQARQFYNNILELGPGVAIRFSDRYNIVLRYESIHGRYLPANSPSKNPYRTHYYNGITELDTYFEF